MDRISFRFAAVALLLLTLGCSLLPSGALAGVRLFFYSNIVYLRDRVAGNPKSSNLEKSRIVPGSAEEISDLRRSLAEALAQNEQLRTELASAKKLAGELAEFRELEDFRNKSGSCQVAVAEILNRIHDWQGGAAIIDRGAADGIVRGDAVLQGQEVVGQVAETGENVARVLLINNKKIVIPATLGNTRAECYVQGGEDGKCQAVFLGSWPAVEKGDMVFTNNQSGHFPSNLIIGVVDGLPIASADGRSFTVLVSPRVKLGELEHVIVLRSGKVNLIEGQLSKPAEEKK